MRHVKQEPMRCTFAVTEMLTSANQYDLIRKWGGVPMPGFRFRNECLPGLSDKAIHRGWRDSTNGLHRGCKRIQRRRLKGKGAIICQWPTGATHIAAYCDGMVYDGEFSGPLPPGEWCNLRPPHVNYSVHPWCDKRAERNRRGK